MNIAWILCETRMELNAHFIHKKTSSEWDPWRALHGRHGCEIHLRDGEMSITPFKRVWACNEIFGPGIHKWSGRTKYDDINGPTRTIYVVISGPPKT